MTTREITPEERQMIADLLAHAPRHRLPSLIHVLAKSVSAPNHHLVSVAILHQRMQPWIEGGKRKLTQPIPQSLAPEAAEEEEVEDIEDAGESAEEGAPKKRGRRKKP